MATFIRPTAAIVSAYSMVPSISGDLSEREKTSYNFGLRRSWMDLLTRPAFAIMNHKSNDEDKLSMSYFFHDLNFKLTNIFNERSRMSLSVYSGEDRLDAKDEWHSNNSSGYNDVDIYVNRFHWGKLQCCLRLELSVLTEALC